MTSLPTGWRHVPLIEAAEVSLGQSPPGTSYNDTGHGTPFFQGKTEFTSTYAEVRKYTTAGTKFAKTDDVLVSVRAPVGPTNLAPVDCAIGRGLAALRARAGVDQRYLLWAMRATEGKLAQNGAGSTFAAVTGAQLKVHEICLPPTLDEQRRIVDLLEDHLSRLDAGVDSLRTSLRRANAMVVSSLATQVTDGRDRWPASTVGANAEIIQYGSSAKCDARATETDIPVLRMGNVKDGGLVWGSLKYLPAGHDDFPKLLLQHGDLLFNRTNSADHVGKSAVFDVDCIASFASYLIRVRFRPSAFPHGRTW